MRAWTAVRTSLVTPLAYGSVALAWSGSWILGKVGVGAVPPLELSALRFAIAGTVLLAIAVVTRTSFRGAPIGAVVASAFTGYFAYNALAFLGLSMTPASDAALLVPTTIPVFTSLAATFVGERLDRRRLGGLAVATLGAAAVIAAGQEGGALSERRLAGDLLLLASSACWGIYTALGAVTLRSMSPFAVVALAAPIGALMLFPLGFLESGYADVGAWSGTSWLAVLYLAIVGTVGSFVVYYWTVQRYGAGLASLTSYLVPVVTLLIAFVALGERPHPLQLVGGAIILAGAWLVSRRPRSLVEVEIAGASEAL